MRYKRKVNRKDKNGKYLCVGDLVENIWTKAVYEVIFAEDILAYGLYNPRDEFQHMSEWVASDWQIIRKWWKFL